MMSFSAVPNSNISLGRVAFNCDGRLDAGRGRRIPEPLPSRSHMLVLSGRPGCGKTSVMVALLARRGRLFNRMFQWVLYVSPSGSSLRDDPFASLPEGQRWTELSPETVAEIDVTIETIPTEDSILLILDDCLSALKVAPIQKTLLRWAANRRHLHLSIWLTSQVWNRIPRAVRVVASHLVLFPTTNRTELKTIQDEVGIMDPTAFAELMRWCFSFGPHSFVFIDLIRPRVYRRFDKIRIEGVPE